MTVKRCFKALAAGLLMLTAASAAAAPSLLPEPAETPTPSPTPVGISVESGAADDRRIAARVAQIFSQLPELNGVQIRVAAGVVTLGGVVSDADAIEEAGAIAGRVAGVVTVQNNLTRNLAVRQNLDPAMSGVVAKLRGLVQALPLLGIAILVALGVIVAGYLLARQRRLWLRLTPNPFLAELAGSAVRFVAIIAGIVLALEIMNATALLGAVLGGAGVIGIAIGFAVRDSIDNYVSSLLLSIRQPFRANDSVKIDEYEGRVIRLHSRATVLMTFDGNHLRLPNSLVFKAVITNYSRNPKRRFKFELPIDHDGDPCRARSVGVKAMRSLDFILDEPEPISEIHELAGTTNILRFYGWVDQTRTDILKARTAAIEVVRSALRQAEYVFPDTRYLVQIEPPGDKAPRGDEELPTIDDVAPRNTLKEMVAEERSGDEGQDLLDRSQPEE